MLHLYLQPSQDYVLSIATTADRKWLISGSRDKTFRIWDSESGELEATVRGNSNSVISVAASGAQNLIATASGDKTVTLWKYE